VIQRLRTRLENDGVFQSLADDTPFIEGNAADGEPLAAAGLFDANGALVVPEGRIYNTKVVLDELVKTQEKPAESQRPTDSESGPIVDVACLAIRFDISKAREKAGDKYVGHCWRVLFSAANPPQIANICNWGELFEGKSERTKRGEENVYVIALDMAKPGSLTEIQQRLLASQDFLEVGALPVFEEGEAMKGNTLRSAGTLDNSGNISVPHGAKPGWHPAHVPETATRRASSRSPAKKGCLVLVLTGIPLLAAFGYLLLGL
jgi:hypothetical protein